MFHLIDKVYLAPDFMLDVHKDRIVVSKDNGYIMHEVIMKLSNGILYKSGNTVEEVLESNYINFFREALSFSRSRERSLYIYADKYALPKIQAIWFKMMFEHIDYDVCYKIYNANVHKFNLFYKSAISSNSGALYTSNKINAELIKDELVNTENQNLRMRRLFCIENKDFLSLEYQLATYLYNGKMKSSLKQSLKKIMRKHFDGLLLEYKSMFLSNYTNPYFAEKIGLEKKYSFNNLDIFSDKSKITEFFMSGRLYKTSEVTKYSSNSNFIFENMTKDDLETLNVFADALGPQHSFNNLMVNFNDGSSSVTRDGYKWQFLGCVTGEFTDELLNNLIDLEAEIDFANGTFYNPTLETVNGFNVQYILQLHKNKETETLKKFIVME